MRVPELRKLSKELAGSPEAAAFLAELPHAYYDENMLHGLLVTGLRGRSECLAETERFLPYVDNWATCDSLNPKVLKRDPSCLFERATVWISSPHEYTCRYGIGVLMRYFLDENFNPEYLKIVSGIERDEYYVKMMIACYFATALAKQYDFAVGYIENSVLDRWIHNKTIQKAVESYRVTNENKEYLKTLRR